MSILIRPSVQRSLDLIGRFADAAVTPQQKIDADPCAQGTCGHSSHVQGGVTTLSRWCDCVVSYRPLDLYRDGAGVTDLTVIKPCGWYHHDATTALADLRKAMEVCVIR